MSAKRKGFLMAMMAMAGNAGAISIPGDGSCSLKIVGSAIEISCGTIPPGPVIPGPTNPNPPPPNPTPPAAGCPGAQHLREFTENGQKHEMLLPTGQVLAVGFSTGAESRIEVNTTDPVGTPPDADHEVAVSVCPGDFSPKPPCRYQATLAGQTMFTSTVPPTLPWLAGSYCVLQPRTRYYMNVRQIVRGSVGTPSCRIGACPIRVQIQNYFP